MRQEADVMELTIRVLLGGTLTTRRAADIAEQMKRYEARVLLRRANITVNAKSLMGLVTLGLRDGMAVTILAQGEDEALAAQQLSALLGA